MTDALDQTLTMPDGRTVGFADFGPPDGVPVIDCHGGPASRFAPRIYGDAPEAGFRMIGIDRPGYGLSTPLPGRLVADWVPDALAVADALGLDQFMTIGSSTGASYAMALAALAPERVSGAIACCGITDMRNAALKSQLMESTASFRDIWSAGDRDATIAVALEQWGEDGMKTMSQAADPQAANEAEATPLPEADMALLTDGAYLMNLMEITRNAFTFGVQGYADDRIADGLGWGSFDVAEISCPVIVLHGLADTVAPPVLADYTASIVPGAKLKLVPDLGHFSIGNEVLATLTELRTAVAANSTNP